MSYQPDWFEGSGLGGKTRDDMPMDVGKLVAEELIIHLYRLKDLGEGFRDSTYFLYHLTSFCRCQLKQFHRVPLEHQ